MPHHPTDMFDSPPAELQRVGSHRAPGGRGGGWITFAWAALATGVLVAVGVVAVTATEGTGLVPGLGDVLPGASPSPTVSLAPVLDPRVLPSSRDASVTVLNATTHVGLQTDAQHVLRVAHWSVVSTADAAQTDLDQTIIYYRKSADQGIARGVAAALGVGTVVYTKDVTFGAAIEVVLGEDYYAASEESAG